MTLWSTRSGFLMAATGFAVGLGNIWRFPYVTGENGGAAFVLVYLVCVLVLGVPIVMGEILLGRRGRMSPPGSLRNLAIESARSQKWAGIGYLNLATAYFIQIGYAVVIGWVLYFLYLSAFGEVASSTISSAPLMFDAFLQNPWALLGWTLLALGLTASIVYAGVEKGIEPVVKVLMPILFLLLLGLALFNVFNGGMGQALNYLFSPDFSKLTPAVGLAALGQAFFSIGVAMAGMMMFGAYLPQDIDIGQSAFIIVLADTLVAITAGLVIFPLVFNYGLDPAGGTGLIFKTLPLAFSQMPGAHVVSTLFFLLLAVAAITSLVGMFEPLVVWCEERFQLARRGAVLVVGLSSALGCIVSVLSYNAWQNVTIWGVSLNVILDFVPNQILLPLGGLLIAVFVAWRLEKGVVHQELRLCHPWFGLWYATLRYVTIPLVLIILIVGLLG